MGASLPGGSGPVPPSLGLIPSPLGLGMGGETTGMGRSPPNADPERWGEMEPAPWCTRRAGGREGAQLPHASVRPSIHLLCHQHGSPRYKHGRQKH